MGAFVARPAANGATYQEPRYLLFSAFFFLSFLICVSRTGDGIPQSAGEYGDGDMIESFGNSTMMSGVTGGSTPAAAIGGRLLFDSTAKKHMSIAVRGGNETPATPNARAAIDAAVAPLSSVSDATAPHGIGNRTKAKPRARVSFGSAAAPRRLLDTPLTSRGISVTSFPTLSSSIAHASGHNEVGDDERTPVRNSMAHHRAGVASVATPAAPLARPHTTRAAGGVLSGVASAAATATAAAGSTAAVVDAPSTVNFLRSKPAAIETGIAPGTGAAVSHGASISTATAAAFSIANTRGTGYNSAAIDVATAAAAAHDLDQLPSHEFAACVDACARAVQAVHMYRCSDALATIDALPAAHRASAAVQALAGRACFEMAAYARACDHYARALRAEPERVDACGAHHSSALWQLRRDAQLAALAHRLQASSASTTSVANAGAAVAGAPASGGAALGALFESNFAPTPWQAGSVDACLAAGNCFSLQREHELALRMFRKASEIDAQCAYAHTLAAHEHAACEDFEKAVAEYRHAIRIDERHYNAWYGLGHVYFRQEKHQLAIYHFQRAIAIHPRSPVLHCYLGMVLHDMRCGSDAVRVLRRAAALEPHASQARFQLALVLLSQRRHDEALVELNAVCAHAPREAAVHAALGRAYRAIGCVQAAVVHWTRALDLDPKDRARVKAMLDRVGRRGSGSGSGALEASDEDDEDNDDDENDNDDDDGILHDSDLDAQEGDEDECDGGDDGDEGDEEIDDA